MSFAAPPRSGSAASSRPSSGHPSGSSGSRSPDSPGGQTRPRLQDRIDDARKRLRTVARVAMQTGLMWEVSLPGLRAAIGAIKSRTQNPSQLYRIHAINNPRKAAILSRDRVISYEELDERMDRLAAGLSARGFGRGSSVVLVMRNRAEFVELTGALARIGGPAVSVSWRSTPSELVYLANHCGARAVVFEDEFWPVVEQAKRELPNIDAKNFICLDGTVAQATSYSDLIANTRDFAVEKGAIEDAAVVIYTSGTTGKPKGAVRKFPKDALPAALRFIAETPMRSDDVHLVTCPLYHSTAYGFLTLTSVLGATVVLLDEFKPEAFLRAVEKHRATTTALVPTMLHRLMALGPEVLAAYDTRSLRAIFVGGSPLPGPLSIQVMDHFGDILFNFYGATETGLVTLGKPDDLRASPGTIGRAVPGNEIRLLDDAGNDVARGEVGELYVRNKLLVAGYHEDESATRASMRDGFFSVGDLARQDRDGCYFIEGRKRDMVISGGVNVYPAEVEGVLEQHPEIAEVAVVGVSDPEWGERVRAFVSLHPGAALDEATLKLWLRERLAGPKQPRDIVFLPSLPRNPTGKVLKRELREWRA
jgi:fatty-acyl-CoA synthase